MSDGISWVAPLIMTDGPLVLLSEDDAESWTGYAGPDYDLACEIAASVGIFSAREGKATLLGGHAPVTCIGQSGNTVLIFRLFTTSSPFRLPASLSEIFGEKVGESVAISPGPHWLFDSVCDGENLSPKECSDLIVEADARISCRHWEIPNKSEYFIYLISNARAVGEDLRAWMRARVIRLED